MSETLDLLAVGPHPDDVELCVGGTLASLTRQGRRVGILDLSRGEMATNGTPAEREREAAAAAEVLGLALRENLGLPDAGLDARDQQQVHALIGALRQLRPSILLAPPPAARHPDHTQASALVCRAAFLAGLKNVAPSAGPAFRPARILFYEMRVQIRATMIVDVSADYASKEAAIACYASQLKRAEGAAPTLANSPLTLSAIEARDRVYGARIGARYGEPLQLDGALGTTDLVASLALSPPGAPHLFEPAR